MRRIPVRLVSPKKIVVVGWEGADWTHARPLLDGGHLPALASLIQAGCSGPIRGFAPWLPPVSWTTLATGVHPDRHGIHGVAVFDETTGRPAAAGTGHRRVPAIWNYFSAQARPCAVLGWPGTYPAESFRRGIMVSDAFAHAPLGPNDSWAFPSGSVSPLARAEDLAELRLHPEEIDAGLLGLFVPKLSEIDQAVDPRPGWLLRQLSELYTMHNTAAVLCAEAQPDFLAVHFPFIATVQQEFGIFQAHRHPAAGAGDCERYGEVVSSAYRLLDALLADLVNACAADTAVVVVSAHGLAHGAARPALRPHSAAGYAAWCRPHGLLVMKGPGLRAGETISGARVEDLAPTLLAWSGFAPDTGMDGRTLKEIFSSPPVPAHPHAPGDAGGWVPVIVTPQEPQATSAAGRLILRLIDRGLVNPLTNSTIEAGRWLQGENAFLLGVALSDLHRPADALAPFHQAFLAAPESPRRALSLIHCLLRLGLTDEALPVAQLFLDHGPHDSRHRLVRALELNRTHPQEALRLLAGVTEPEFGETRRELERMALSRLHRLPESPANPDAVTWPQLMEKADARQTMRADLHERAELYRAARAQTRSTRQPAWRLNAGGDPASTGDTGESVLSSANGSASWSVRPPWPDEMPRVLAQFAPALRHARNAAKQWIWVLVAEAGERLAGVIVLGETEAGSETGAGLNGRVDLDVREAWIGTPAGDALLGVVMRHAATLGLASLDLQARADEAMDALLRRHGFAEVIRHEVWTTRLPAAIALHQAEYGRILQRWPVQLEPFRAGHLETARRICAGTGLLAPGKLTMRSSLYPRGIEPALSFVAGPPDRPVAILLASIDGSRAEVEIVARNPVVSTAAPAAVPALMSRFLMAARDLGCVEARCSLRPEITPSLIVLMKKLNGHCQQRQAGYRLRLVKSGGAKA